MDDLEMNQWAAQLVENFRESGTEIPQCARAWGELIHLGNRSIHIQIAEEIARRAILLDKRK